MHAVQLPNNIRWQLKITVYREYNLIFYKNVTSPLLAIVVSILTRHNPQSKINKNSLTFVRVAVDIVTFQFWHRDGLFTCNCRKEETFDWNIGTDRKSSFVRFPVWPSKFLRNYLKKSDLVAMSFLLCVCERHIINSHS